MADKHLLAGLRVLVTRPMHQAGGLCLALERAGATAIRFPTIAIAPPVDPPALERIVDRLDEFDIAIFVSANAVNGALPVIGRRHRAWPTRVTIVCIGAGTGKALDEFGIKDALLPEHADSEGLLQLPLLRQVHGKRIVIFRGEGGRELLGESLKARGARVEYAECYRRRRPEVDAAPIANALIRQEIDIITATSAEALRNLQAMLDERGAEALVQVPLLIVSERVREIAREIGLIGPVSVARSASDDAIVAAIEAWREPQKNL